MIPLIFIPDTQLLHMLGLAAITAPAAALWIDYTWGEPPARLHPVVWMGRALAALGCRIAPPVPRPLSHPLPHTQSLPPQTTIPLTQRTSPPHTHQPNECNASIDQRGTEHGNSCPQHHPHACAAGALAWMALALPVVLIAATVQAGLFAIALYAGAYLQYTAGATLGVGLLLGVALGAALKPLLAWRMLRDEVHAVEATLAQSLPAGRARVAWLVSRDTSNLSAPQVRAAALSTLAENLNDSVIAPLLWFALLGLPGAALYRMANTADAMWGYPGWRPYSGHSHASTSSPHSGDNNPHATPNVTSAANAYPADITQPLLWQNWHWAGKWAARADDVLSWLPARLSAILLYLAASIPSGHPFASTRPHPASPPTWHDLRQQASQTPSPNSGWPMAALALILDIRLEKTAVYTLHPSGCEPAPQHTPRAISLCQRTIWLSVPALLSISGILVSMLYSL